MAQYFPLSHFFNIFYAQELKLQKVNNKKIFPESRIKVSY